MTNAFAQETQARISENANSTEMVKAARDFMRSSTQPRYSYNFSALGRPIIQYPQDMVAMQELIWNIKPDLIVETGIAHGGSLIMSASMLALIDYCEAVEQGKVLDTKASSRMVLGVDIDIRAHNRAAILEHPMAHKIKMIQGSAINPEIVQQVHEIAKPYKKILVCLDSNHTHDHVLEELCAYAPLASHGSYCVVFDTIVEDLPAGMYPERPWDVGNNPKTAVFSYLKELRAKEHMGSDHTKLMFEIDKAIDNKILISVAPDGYLRRV